MALNVTLNGGSGGATTWTLKAEQCSITYDRSPIIAPIPGGVNPFILDLGSFKTKISLEGKILDTETESGVPNKEELEDLLNDSNWFSNTITLTVGGDAYVCVIANCTFTLVGAREEWWTYVLTFQSEKRS